MDNMNERLKACLDKNGIDFFDEDSISSIAFITLVIDIEQEFDISFPDEYLVMDLMESFENLYKAVTVLIDSKVIA